MKPTMPSTTRSIASAAKRRPSTSVGSPGGGSYGNDTGRLSLKPRPGFRSLGSEVLVVAAGRWPALALVLRSGRAAAVGMLGCRSHLEERDLPDLHLGVDRNREVGHVRQLEREVSVPTCINEAGGVRHEHSSVSREEVLDVPAVRPDFEVVNRFREPGVAHLDDAIPQQVARNQAIEPRVLGAARGRLVRLAETAK